jgi:hypothetical protein
MAHAGYTVLARDLLVPQGGFEPSTYRLRSDCSAVELLRRPQAGLVAKKAAAVEARANPQFVVANCSPDERQRNPGFLHLAIARRRRA